MKGLAIILLFLFSSVFPLKSYSQDFHTTSNKALKVYKDGMTAFDYFDYNSAENYFKEAISLDKKFYEAYMMLGELMINTKNYPLAAYYYGSAVKIDSLFFKPVFFNLANSEMMSGLYSSALIHFNVYLAQTGMSEKNLAIAKRNIKNCEFALIAIKSPVSFSPVNLGSSVNTPDDEYWPSITADGQTLMFTRQPKMSMNSNLLELNQEDFYISNFRDKIWQPATNAGAPLNTNQNEGAQTLSSDGSYMYFTACNRPDGLGSCDIYFSAFKEGKWSIPYNLGPPVNTPYWETQPSISADGKTLFFSSSRPGGIGGKDLWVSTLNEKNLWTSPKNMGKTINTDGDEMSPFIHFDGRTLYFASDGRVGMGGFDIFFTRMNDDSTWTEPQNLGYPINTFNDEMGLVIESNGQKAYFSAIRDKSKGKDIFSFDLYESARPNPVSYLKGKVYDKETGKLLRADYELINLSSDKISIKSSTDAAGNFLVCLPSGYNYGINVNKEGYLFYSENFMFEGEHTVEEPFIKKIVLSQIKVGEMVLLTNVFYEIDSWELKQESTIELNNLALLLTNNEGLSIEIGGHTDFTGSAEYNLVLSEKRALSVVNYLIKRGISANRLTYKGYGNTIPLSDNSSAEGRKLNRRTEAKIIESHK